MRKRYVQMDDGELVEVGDDYNGAPRHANAAHNIITDIQPYQSMVDGSEISSRSRHREHLRSHGMIEIGNETKHLKPFGTYTPPAGLKETIVREVNKRAR